MAGSSLPDNLSFSQLSTYHSCGEKWRLQKVERVPQEPQGAWIGGRAVHRAIQESEREGWWPDEDTWRGPEGAMIAFFLAELERGVAEDGGSEAIRWGGRKDRQGNPGEDLAWWRKNGEFMLRRYVDTRVTLAEAGYEPIEGGVEMKVVAEVGGIPVVGYLDKFLMHEAGEPVILDYKGGQIGRADPLQFATYAALLERSRGIVVERGLAIFLRAADAARRIAPVRFAELVPRMDEVYEAAVAGISAGLFPVRPGPFCPSCSVRDSCWYWRGTNGPPADAEAPGPGPRAVVPAEAEAKG